MQKCVITSTKQYKVKQNYQFSLPLQNKKTAKRINDNNLPIPWKSPPAFRNLFDLNKDFRPFMHALDFNFEKTHPMHDHMYEELVTAIPATIRPKLPLFTC